MEHGELQSLISGALRKEQKAQTRLINFFWQDIFTFVQKKVHDETIADELTVAVFAKVLARLELYDKNFQFKTWALTIAQNTVIDFWRRQNRSLEDGSENINYLKNDFAKSPEEIMISEQEAQKILKTVASLETGYRKIIELRFFEEKSIREISEELGISVSNAKVRIMRAKKMLQEMLRNGEAD